MGNSQTKSCKASDAQPKKCSGCNHGKHAEEARETPKALESPVVVVEAAEEEKAKAAGEEAKVDAEETKVAREATTNKNTTTKEEAEAVVVDGAAKAQTGEKPAAAAAETRAEEQPTGEAPVVEYSIANQKLKLTSAEDVAEHVEFIRAHPELKLVNLTGNTLGVEASKALAEALTCLDKIEEFDLHDCFTGRMKEEVHVAVEAFNKVLKTKPTLRKVDFSDNAFGPAGAQAVAVLLSEAVDLEELILNNNGLGPQGGNIIAQALIDLRKRGEEAGQAASKLRRVEIGRNRLENGSAPALSEAFKAHGLLEEIALPQCGIRPEGISELAKGIAANPNLTKVNLQDNTFTSSGSAGFAKALEKLGKLQTLNIGDCLVGSDGCIKIVEALIASGCPIESLNLQFNEMNEEGVRLLARSLDKLGALKVLMLNGNCFNPVGEAAAALKDTLQKDERTDILDSWSEMEYYSDEDDSDLDPEKEMECEVQESDDELAGELSRMNIAKSS